MDNAYIQAVMNVSVIWLFSKNGGHIILNHFFLFPKIFFSVHISLCFFKRSATYDAHFFILSMQVKQQLILPYTLKCFSLVSYENFKSKRIDFFPLSISSLKYIFFLPSSITKRQFSCWQRKFRQKGTLMSFVLLPSSVSHVGSPFHCAQHFMSFRVFSISVSVPFFLHLYFVGYKS